MSKQVWRLITTGPLSGAENMAVDEALLRSFDPQSSLPVLRLYGWNPAALSLGRFQKAADALNLSLCRSDHVSIVRRITGGGVIYHADELTYSIVCSPEQIPPASSVKDSFRVLTGFLLEFYKRSGFEAVYAVDAFAPGTRLGERTPFCFAGKETFDIMVNGCKIGGNAQRRLKDVIFQHGSIPVLNRAEKGLSYMLEHALELIAGTTSIAECLGGIYGADLPEAPYHALFRQLEESFKASFSIEFIEDSLTSGEQELASVLLETKYLKDKWNFDGVSE